MKCPNCGYEMQEGHLICEGCGYEVRIVPDYDPETDLQIDNAVIDSASKDILSAISSGIDTMSSGLDDTIHDITLDMATIRKRALYTIGIILAVIAVAVCVVLIVIQTSSLDNQLEKIKKKAISGKYEDAIHELENLYVHYPKESEIFFLEAQYYQELDKPEMAVDTLDRMLANSGNYSDEEMYQVYDRLIDIYVASEKYDEIESLLNECEYPDIVTAYQNYLAMPPTFSLEGGQYTDVIRLKLSANTSGTIYYTLDGSVPNETSDEYGGNILLETGEYKVSAIFVNQYGIVSDVASESYQILVAVPDAPIVNYDTGNYTTPGLIEVEVPEGTTVYYTTDKSVPTVDSVPYTGPIPIPLNTSNFNFVAINDQGLASETVVRSYKLSFPDGLSSQNAISILKQRMMERGMINDAAGHSDRAPGTYSYVASSAIRIEGQGDYYIIREFHNDGSGNKTSSDTTYIVEIYQGSTGILGGDAVNGFIALAF